MPSSTFLAASSSFIARSSFTTALAFSRAAFLFLLGMDRFEHLGYQLHLGARRNREHIAVKVDGTPLLFGFGEYFAHSLQHTETLVTNNKFHTVQTSAAQPLKEADPAGLIPAHGLYCFARQISTGKTGHMLTMPEHHNFLKEYAAWRMENPHPTHKLYFEYPAPMELLNQVLMAPVAKSSSKQPYLNSDNQYLSPKDKKAWYLDEKAMLDAFCQTV